MDKEFFQRKLNELSNEKLIDLLKTGRTNNLEIFQLAREEAARRNLPYIDNDNSNQEQFQKEQDLTQLDKWNWAAFLFSPFWALANKLEKWALLLFVPGVNIFVIFYLGRNGNRLAYRKNKGVSIDDFMAIQRYWGKSAIWLFVISIGIVALIFIISII